MPAGKLDRQNELRITLEIVLSITSYLSVQEPAGDHTDIGGAVPLFGNPASNTMRSLG
jgi:hypothetical protein